MGAHPDAAFQQQVRHALRDVPNFPSPGITFKDISPVLKNPVLLAGVIGAMSAPWRDAGITHVAGIESRGFIFGAPIALALGAGFIPLRKPGKLPWKTAGVDYALEYGHDRMEMHVDACTSSSRVLLVDDVLATGGTAAAACSLIEQVGGSLAGCSFLLRIAFLNGDARLAGRRIESFLDT